MLPSRRPTDAAFLRITREISSLPAARSTSRKGADAAWPAACLLLVALLFAGFRVASASADGAVVPCAPVHYAIEMDGAPAGVAPAVAAAFARFAEVTGVTTLFVDDHGAASKATVRLAWIDGAAVTALAGKEHAVGFTRGVVGTTLSGTIYLNRDARLPVDAASRRSWGGVIMHELGHLAGLDHSPDAAEIMHAEVADGALSWGVTDRSQLRSAAARLGCRPS